MKELKNILYKVKSTIVIGSTNIAVSTIEFDSRNVVSNSLFVAQKGLVYDGHKFIEKAIELGAKVIVCEELPKDLQSSVTYVQVENSNSALAMLASPPYKP